MNGDPGGVAAWIICGNIRRSRLANTRVTAAIEPVLRVDPEGSPLTVATIPVHVCGQGVGTPPIWRAELPA